MIEERIIRQLYHENLVRYLGSAKLDGQQLVLGYERAHPNPVLLLSRPEVRKHFPHDPGTPFCPLPRKLALALGLDLLRGLEHMHSLGFVHHDVKLSNLMIRLPGSEESRTVDELDVLEGVLEGRARGVLIDIGATRSVEFLEGFNRGEVDPGVVPPQMTPTFAPPEALLAGETEWGPRPTLHPSLDLYAAGLVLYTSLSGRAPYDHCGVDWMDLDDLLAAKRLEREGRLLPICFEGLADADVGSLADDLFAFLKVCVQRDPAERPSYRAAREFVERLERQVTSAAASVTGPALEPRVHRPT